MSWRVKPGFDQLDLPLEDHDVSFGEGSEVDSDLCGSDMYAHNEHEQKREEPAIARAETRAVRSLRFLVLLFLLLSAVAVALAVYYYTRNSQLVEFQSSFRDSTQKVMDSIGKAIERTLGAVDAFETTLISHARDTNQTWPFVTIPNFAARTEKVRSLSAAVIISMNPLVTPEQRHEWEAYAWENQAWLNESMKVQETDPNYYGEINYDHQLTYPIHHDLYDVPYNETRLMAPQWQNSPVETQTRSGSFNWDLLSQTSPEATIKCIESKEALLMEAYNLPDPNNPDEVAETAAWAEWFKSYVEPGEDPGAPASDIYWPLIDRDLGSVLLDDDTPSNPKVVGVFMISFFWRDMIKDMLPKGNNGVVIVFENPCSPTFTYRVDGPTATFLGRGDQHETKFNDMAVTSLLKDLHSFSISNSKYLGLKLNEEYCPFSFTAYPSSSLEAEYVTNSPIYFTIGALLIFGFTSAIFLLYDFVVERRQKKVMTTAVRSNAIVSSLFPSVVRDRVYQTEEQSKDGEKKNVFKLSNSKTRLKSFLTEDSDGADVVEHSATAAPIAELFPETTVLFADIAGFTAWSSIREPCQVFTLLETLYGAFDAIARKRGVFKVETIGDSYVAVCGLPEPRENHAVVMCRFARDCRDKMNELTRNLETTLGPDTGDLKLRFGLNSGPVTAGVLRGERSRFQLFGDTVNCAARMESNGRPNMIQVSQKTADLLRDAGKDHWLTKRDELVEAKGKGKLQTYWVDPPRRTASAADFSASDTASSESDALHIMGVTVDTTSARLERLIDWNVDTFTGLIKRIVGRRMTMDSAKRLDPLQVMPHDMPRSEVAEIIMLPEFEFNLKDSSRHDISEIRLSEAVVWQLRDVISVIAYMYRSNPFHNFEHASHVAQSIMKLLQRVVSPDVSVSCTSKCEKEVARAVASNLHFSTYGITSDPLTQFAIVFAALIHDVDHPGVSNGQLVAEKDPMAQLFNNQSVAEQNSISIAWELLMRPEYDDLRNCLFADGSELKRFRQLVVNSVMATDIFDKDLKAMREARWEKAFDSEVSAMELGYDAFNRRATIIIEHLIQASDVAHTMQHWTIYQKWNRRLFEEVFKAFRAGRSPSNPADGWYKGELWFFDNYIIPLARKLKECHVFGVACDEFLDYAVDNRTEWEAKGEDIVRSMLEDVELRYRVVEKPEAIIRRMQAQAESDKLASSIGNDNPTGESEEFCGDVRNELVGGSTKLEL